MDGHTLYTEQLEMMKLAENNDIVKLCLLSHSTKWLQSLDKRIYKLMKLVWNRECQNFVTRHPGRKIKRTQFGKLLSKTWQQLATMINALSGFRSCGIELFDPCVISGYANLTFNPLNVCSAENDNASCHNNEMDLILIKSTITDTVTPLAPPAIYTATSSLNDKLATAVPANDETPTKVLKKISLMPIRTTVAHIKDEIVKHKHFDLFQ